MAQHPPITLHPSGLCLDPFPKGKAAPEDCQAHSSHQNASLRPHLAAQEVGKLHLGEGQGVGNGDGVDQPSVPPRLQVRVPFCCSVVSEAFTRELRDEQMLHAPRQGGFFCPGIRSANGRMQKGTARGFQEEAQSSPMQVTDTHSKQDCDSPFSGPFPIDVG